MAINPKSDTIDNHSSNYKLITECDYQYYITDDGRVWTTQRSKGIERFLKAIEMAGYCYVDLRKNGKVKRFAIHRLVATYFIPNPENKPFVNHIDGNRKNNCVENLEWCTQKENMWHARHILGKCKATDKSRALASIQGKNNRKITMKQANELRRLYWEEHISIAKLSEIYKLSITPIRRILNGKTYKN